MNLPNPINARCKVIRKPECCLPAVCLAMLLSAGVAFAVPEPRMGIAGDSCNVAGNSVPSLDMLLRGKLSGVRVFATDGNPLSSVVTQIRGINSVRGSSDPLWIVDGVILNPLRLDVESMFWQHDGADYTGQQNSLALINPSDVERIEVVKNLAATAIYGSKGANGAVIVTTKQARRPERVISWQSNLSLVSPVKTGETMLDLERYKGFQGRLGKDAFDLEGQTDWQDKMLDNTFAHNHLMSISEMRRSMRYNISGNMSRIATGLDCNDGWTAGAHINFDMAADKFFNFGIRVNIGYASYSMMKGVNLLGNSSSILSIMTAAPAVNAPFNPQDWQAGYDDDSEQYRITPALYFTLDIVKGLKLNVDAGVDYIGKDRYMWYGNQTEFGSGNNGAASFSSLTAFHYNFKPLLNYGYSNKCHTLNMGVGVELYGNRYIYNTHNGLDFFAYDLRAKGVNLAASKVNIHKYNVNNDQFGILGTFFYEYRQKYGVDVVFKGDQSKKYDREMTFYPGISVYWNVGNEYLLKRSNVISGLKFSAGYGKAGSQFNTPYEWFGRYYTGLYPQYTDGVQMFHDGFFKTISTEYNGRIELGVADDHICLAAGYYDRQTDDKANIFSFGREGDAGLWMYDKRKSVHEDAATFTNRGFEFDFSAQVIRNKNWQWDVNFNVTTNKTNVVSAENGAAGQSAYLNANMKGHVVSALYGYKYKGIVTQDNVASAPSLFGSPLSIGDLLYDDADNSGDIDGSDRTVIGNPHPKIFGGFNTRLAYKRFSLHLGFDGAFGHDILNLERMMREDVSGRGNITRNAYGRALAAMNTDSPSYPRFGAQGTMLVTDRFVEKGDYVRLSSITLGYEAPIEKIKWIKLLHMFVNVRNAALFTSYKGWNPDINCFGSDNAIAGIAYGGFPNMRYFTLGVNASF